MPFIRGNINIGLIVTGNLRLVAGRFLPSESCSFQNKV